MSLEPEKPIEKLLRDCAKERRERAGDSWELHPVNRRLLQEEVARKFAASDKPAPRLRPKWMVLPWWIGAMSGIALLMILAGGVWFLAQRPSSINPTLMARNEKAAEPAVNDKLSSKTPAPLTERESVVETSADRKALALKEESLGRGSQDPAEKDVRVASAPALQKAKTEEARLEPNANAVGAPIDPTAASSTAVPVVGAESGAFRQRYGLSRAMPQQPASSPGAAPAPVKLASGELQQEAARAATPLFLAQDQAAIQSASVQSADLAAGLAFSAPGTQVVQYGYFAGTQVEVGQRVAQQASRPDSFSSTNKKRDNASQILSYFRIEQSGAELRVIDSDNSVYAGQLEGVPASSSLASAVEQAPLTSRAFQARAVKQQSEGAKPSSALKDLPQQAAVPGYAFQVAGTNRTTNQRVVFSGILSGITNLIVMQRAQIPGSDATAKVQPEGTSRRQFSETQSNSISQGAHVFGKALIGSDEAVSIEAMPVPVQTTK
jgi:hypothetical protein